MQPFFLSTSAWVQSHQGRTGVRAWMQARTEQPLLLTQQIKLNTNDN